MRNIPHIRSLVFNTPLMVTPDFLFQVSSFLNEGDLRANADFDKLQPTALVETPYSSRQDQDSRFVHDGGIAMINVHGGLAQRGGFDMAACESIRGYDGIRQDIAAALTDDRIKGIMMNMDSPGGQVAGNSALLDYMRASPKPIWAFANERAYSAAYGIAAAADRFILPASGGAGSIGVVLAHVSFEGALAAEGVKVTYIHAGDHKVDGNPTVDLSDEVRADLQKEVNYFYKAFTLQVANDRGLQQKSVIETQARSFNAEDAVKLGLADEIMSADETLAAFREHLATKNRSTIGASMSKEAGATAGATVTAEPGSETAGNTFDRAAVDAARQEGIAQGVEQEHARVFGILGHENAQGRMAHAIAFAEDRDVSAATATKHLAMMPLQSPAAAKEDDEPDVLSKAMAQSGADESGVDTHMEQTPTEKKASQADEAAELLSLADAGFSQNVGGIPNVG